MTSSSSLDRALTLHVLLPDATEREFFVQHGLTIGRTDANTVCIDHPDVERIHARVSAQPDGTMVLECQADTAGLFQDGDASPRSRILLAPGTRFQIGPANLTCGSWQARATVQMAGSPWQVRCPRCHASLADLPHTARCCPRCDLSIVYFNPSADSEKANSSFFTGWLPAKVGPYSIRSFVAEGGMGIVLRGLHQEKDKFAAVKLLRLSEGDDPKAEARFTEEVAHLRKCVHPNVVRLQDSGGDQRLIWLALDWVDGFSLQTHLGKLKSGNKAMPIKRIADWLAQIVKGLAYLHEQGIVHRDLKPGNVLVTADGLVKITDFSIAKAPLAGLTSMTRTGTVAGSAGYMSPEQWDGRRVGPATDIFSLGILWYELLTQSRPVGSYQSAATRRTDCPPGWDALIARCLSFNPEQRPTTDEIQDGLALRRSGASRHKGGSRTQADGPPNTTSPFVKKPRRAQTSGKPALLERCRRLFTVLVLISLGSFMIAWALYVSDIRFDGLTDALNSSGGFAALTFATLMAITTMQRRFWVALCGLSLTINAIGALCFLFYAWFQRDSVDGPSSFLMGVACAFLGNAIPIAARIAKVRLRGRLAWLPIVTSGTLLSTCAGWAVALIFFAGPYAPELLFSSLMVLSGIVAYLVAATLLLRPPPDVLLSTTNQEPTHAQHS